MPIFSKKELTNVEVAKSFPIWKRKIDDFLYAKLIEYDAATITNNNKKISKIVRSVIAVRGVNYILGEDWEKNIDGFSEEIKSLIAAHKSEVVPLVKAWLGTDKLYRELIVNYLRIKMTLFFAYRGENWMKSDEYARIEKILLAYGPEFPEKADPIKFAKMVSRISLQ